MRLSLGCRGGGVYIFGSTYAVHHHPLGERFENEERIGASGIYALKYRHTE